MNTLTKFAIFGALALSTSSFTNDCRAIFDPGYSKAVQALVGEKFEIVDEYAVPDARVIPFRIYVKEDLDLDPETMTLKLSFNGEMVIEEKKDSEGFRENVARTEKWLKDLPSCEKLYQTKSGKNVIRSAP